jgi:hypothetical protein
MFHLRVRLLAPIRSENENQMNASFQLSRIYGQGWNAAKQLLAHQVDSRDPKQSETLNPYQSAEERTRWSKGFEKGLLSRTGAHTRANIRTGPHRARMDRI